jgi:hypothetical protein
LNYERQQLFFCTEDHEAYPGHQEDAVNAQLPLLSDHLLRLTPKCACIRGFLAGLLGFEELFGFREAYADESNTD